MQQIIKKIFPLIFILVFIGVFSYFEWEKFFQHTQSQEQNKIWAEKIEEKLEEFSVEKIRKLESTEFFYTPYVKLLDTIVSKINSAKRVVHVEVYMLTETRIKESLIKAKKRWVDVKVVLEHSPYKAVHINKKHFTQLEAAWIDIVWSSPKYYALNHSKIMIIDDEAIISTGNFSYSTFAHNRDLFILTQDEWVVTSLKATFADSYAWTQSLEYNHQLLLSPNYSRRKLEILVESATDSIQIYAQYLKDSKLLRLLEEKANAWIKVTIILSRNWFEQYEEDQKNNMKSKNLKIVAISQKPKMHSKAFLIDGRYLFIGSINFSLSSMDKNREVWIVLKNEEIIKKFTTLFESDL